MKHLFEITQGSNAKGDSRESEPVKAPKPPRESGAKERKKHMSGSGKPQKRRRTRPTSSKVNLAPIALNLVNEKENGEEIGTVKGGSTDRRSNLEFSSKRKS